MCTPKSAGQTSTLFIVAGLLTALTGCGGGGGGGGGSTPPPTSSTPVARFAYVANTGDDTVSVYLADNTTGSLRHHGYAMTGDGPTSLTIDPSGQFAYTLNSNSQDISLFTIDSLAGTLTAADCDAVSNTSCGTGGTPVSLVFGSNGSFAYVANQVSNRITVHQRDPAIGALSDSNSVQPPVDDTTGGSSNPVKLSLHPSGDSLYAVHDTTSDITVYSIDTLNGNLSPVTGSPVASGGSGAIDIAITPDGNFAYVANSTSGDIGLFTVDGSGLLVPNTTSALLTTGLTPQALAVDPTGQWLYMISKQAPGSVSLFQIQSDGTLVQSNCGGSQTCATGDMPASIAIDPTGQFVSVTNESDNTVSLFSIDQNNGQLTTLHTLASRDTPSSVSYYTDTAEVTVTPRFAYVVNSDISTGNSVSAYTINAGNGTLTSLGSPVATGLSPSAVTTDKEGRFAYVSNSGGNSVSGYQINQTSGALSQLTGSPFPLDTGSFGPEAITTDPSSRFAYVANTSTNTVTSYSINQTSGALSLLTGSPSTSSDPIALTTDPTGRFLYAANTRPTNTVSAFQIDPTSGNLSAIGTPIATGSGPNSIVVDPSGRFVYTANVHFSSYNISAYTIDPLTGTLSEISGSPFSAGTAPFSIAVDPLGEFVYVANQSSQTVRPYTINQTTGALTAGTDVLTEANPQSITVDPSGHYVYVANLDSNSVSGYTINASTGALTSTGSSTATGTAPRSIVTTGVVQ